MKTKEEEKNIKAIIKCLFLNSHLETFSKTVKLFFEKYPNIFSSQEKLALKILSENIIVYNENLNLIGTPIFHLANLTVVSGWVNFGATENLKTLGKLKHVNDCLMLRFSKVICLGDLEYVGSNLDIRNTLLKSLGKLKYIGGDLILNDIIKKEDLTKDLVIEGDIYYPDEYDNINSL